MNSKGNQFSSPPLTASKNKKSNPHFDPVHIAFNNSAEVFILVDTKFQILATNGTHHPRAKAYLGFRLKPGTNILNLVSPERRTALKEMYQQVFAGEQITNENKITAGGITTYHRLRYKPAYDNDGLLIGALVTADDITEIKNKEIQLQLSEERWRFALEGSNQGLWDWNVETGRVYFSVLWKKLFGFLPSDKLDTLSHWSKRIHPQDRKLVQENLDNHFISDNPLFESIYRFKAKNGEYRWLLSRGMVLSKDEKGRPRRMIGTHTDITHMHLLEENYKTLFDANPIPAWTYQLDNDHFLEVNQAAIQLYGYSKNEFLSMTMAQLFADSQKWQKENKTFLKTKHYQQHQKKNGELITVKITGHILDRDHENIAMILAEDVTEKAASEQALILSNERFKLASRATSDAIYDWDILAGKLKWGKGLYTLFGYNPDEVQLKNWETYVHPDEQEEVLKTLNETISNPRKKNWKKEYRFKTAKGAYRYVVEKGFILRDKNKKAVRMIGALQDITDIKLKQVELEKSNERFDAVLKATSEFIWDWDLEQNSFYRDPYGLKKVLGVMNPKAISDEKSWLERIHPTDKPGAINVMDSIMNGTIQHVFEREYRFKKDDGNYAFIHDRGIVIRNKEGKPVRLIGAAQDITLRKKLEHELLQKELEKQKIISKATIDTQEQERSEIGRELHDNVNQVLTTTKLYLELAQARPEMKEEMIKKSSSNIIYVINEIRQLSRSLMNPSIGDLGLIDAINDLIDNINATKKLVVKLESNSNIDELLAPDLKLTVYRILQEALNNAIRHSRASTALICIKKKEKSIELTVKDEGIGFNIATVKKGIGLKNIENRVYLMNGRLQVKTTPGNGCTIIVQFPLNKNQS